MRWALWVVLALLVPTSWNASAWAGDSVFADQGAAFAACQADLAVNRKRQASDPDRGIVITDACKFVDPGGSELLYRCSLHEKGVSEYWCGIHGSGHNSSAYRYPRKNTCSSRPSTSGGFFQSGAQTSCSGGCRYDRGTITSRMVLGTKVYYQASNAKPTGDTCTYDATKDDTPVTDDQCQQTGTLTQCVTKEGKHCAVASTGKKFCWQPTETGTKVSGNEAATKAPEGTDISPPPKPPTDGGEWQNSGSGSVSAGGGGTTNNYNVNNWNSNGNGSGNGGGNGNGEGGSGNESGGKDDGDGKGDKPGAGVGELYKGTDKTVAGLMGAFYSKASNAQVMKGITNFMGINSAGGSCPVFTVPASAFWDAMTFDAHCSGTWLQLLQTMGWIVLAIAAYVAVRIAVT